MLHPETAAFFDEFAASVQRLAGPSRYLTARAVADHFFDDNPRAVVIATGQRATDALAAASLGHLSFVGAGRSAMPLLLTETSSLHETVQEYVCSNETIGLAYVAGGPAAVDRDVTDDLEAIWDDTNCRPPPSSE